MSGEIGSIYGPRVSTTRPRIDFWHGIDWSKDWNDILEVIYQRQAWIKHHYGSPAFEDKPLLDGYSVFDLDDNGFSHAQYATIIAPNDLKRVPLLLKQYAAEHDEGHFIRLHPFCPTCRGAMEIARLSLDSWLTRHPGGRPVNTSDADLPWDTERIAVDNSVKQSTLYKNVSQLAMLPTPRDLVEGVIPRRGVGYITGRDRSLKTFLALDICLHVGAMMHHWHAAPKRGEERGTRRKLGWTHGGKIIFAAGEGVSSFSPRIDAWVDSQHVKRPTDDQYKTPEGALALRRDGCHRCAAEVDPYIGHVHNLQFDEPDNLDNETLHIEPGFGELEEENIIIRVGTPNLFAGGDDFRYLLAMARKERPDVIVLDTLALSSGSADQQAATDMGVIDANARLLADAGDCVVIIIAHTDKGDNDARGSSVIEDNADFVLHCTRPDNDRVEVKVAKRKDAEDNWSFILGVEQVELDNGQTSLILQDWDGEDYDPANDEEQDKIEDALNAMERAVSGHKHNSVSIYDILSEYRERAPARPKVSAFLHKAVGQGRVMFVERPGKPTQWYFPEAWVDSMNLLGHEIAHLDEKVEVS